MKERPILFNDEMVRAILAGRKTQTRRIVKPQLEHSQLHIYKDRIRYEGEHRMWCWKNFVLEGLIDTCLEECQESRRILAAECPYGQPGDRLWVRETFTPTRDDKIVLYRADPSFQGLPKGDLGRDWNWTPSIHMPRGASRITMEITSVHIERLKEISIDDAIAEGIANDYHGFRSEAINIFEDYWNTLNAKRGYGWDKNPWVWAIEFKRVEEERTETERALWWIIYGEVGESSKTIWAAMHGMEIEDRWHHSPPIGPSDFRRCRLLLDLIPEWRERLEEVADKDPEWANLIKHWAELEALYDEEANNREMPKLYAKMRELSLFIDDND